MASKREFKALAFIFAAVLVAAMLLYVDIDFSPSTEGEAKTVPSGDNSRRTFSVFVGGDVEREGMYELPVGIYYHELFTLVGAGDFGAFSPLTQVNVYQTIIIFGNCLNINYAAYDDFKAFFGEELARRLTNYIATRGKIDNKYLLKTYLYDWEWGIVERKIYAIV